MLKAIRGRDEIDAATTLALMDAERSGIRLALIGRTVVLLLALGWFVTFLPWPSNLRGAAVIGVFLAVGVVHYWLVVRRRDRWWHRYGFQTIDVAALGALVAFVPLSTGGDVPQIIAFRAHGAPYLFVVIAVAALSLSPGLMLWTGFVAVVALWGAYGWVVSNMERTVSWSDLGAAPTAEKYLSVFLDKDFIGTGNRIEETIFIAATAGILALAVNRARRLVRDRMQAERQRREMSQVLGRYVPQEVVDELVQNAGLLEASTRDASILFVDIEGFTRLSETKSPGAMVTLLNAFFGRVSQIAAAHRGVVISLIGDAAMVAFNAPLANDDHARSALSVARALLDMSRFETFEGERLNIRIGVATGPVSAGSVGGDGRLSYTVYGDTVNVAQRLEELNKAHGTRILANGPARIAAGQGFTCRLIEAAQVRGRASDIEVFAVEAT